MVDTEVENILREIRERVYAEQQRADTSLSAQPPGDEVSERSQSDRSELAEALARIEGHLTTTARAWGRLPPLVSNRSGSLARLELWLKRRLKLATRWYSWEQVNFNAAVHHAFKDVLTSLSALEQQFQSQLLRSQSQSQSLQSLVLKLQSQLLQLQSQLQTLQTEKDALAEKLDEARQEQQIQKAESKSLQAEIGLRHAEISSLRVEIASLRAESESQARLGQEQIQQLNARLEGIAQQWRSADESLLDEQRVCLRQLSLEIGEINTLFDRARRQIETRLNRLENQ